MNATTFEAFREFAVSGTEARIVELPQLAADEQALYANLARANLRLEQERISYTYAVQRISDIATG
jgi:hypothetical protein